MINHADQYTGGCSFFHRLDARIKLVFSLFFILSVVLSPRGQWLGLLALLCLIVLVAGFSRLNMKMVLKRSLAVIPFALMIGVPLPFLQPGDTLAGFHLLDWNITLSHLSHQGSEMLGTLLAKSWVSLWCLVWLTATTQVNALLKGLKNLYVPAVMVTILLFMYRYIFVIVDELQRMIQARDCRSSRGGIVWNIRTAGNMIGSLFIRSFERSERVYSAMLARGYEGQLYTLDESRAGMREILVISLLTITSLSIPAVSFVVKVG